MPRKKKQFAILEASENPSVLSTDDMPSEDSHDRVDLSIILINWRMKADLENCLRSIRAHKHRCRAEVILVNKPSNDGTEALIRDQYPEVKLLDHPEFGFATMRNVGIREARGRYCLILDTDIDILPNCIDRMVGFMDRHPQVGGCGGHTSRLNGDLEYNVKRFYQLMTVVVRRSPVERIWPDNPWNQWHLMKDKNHRRPFYGDWMAGACFCIRRSLIQDVGYFDETLHYFEDVDWCWRAKQRGWRIAFNPGARIIHKVQRLSDKGLNRAALTHLRSGLRFWWKCESSRHHHMSASPQSAQRRQPAELTPSDADSRRPDLSVVVINLNGRQLLDDCLASLRESTTQYRLEVLVVDNGSTDGSPDMVREKYPEAILHVNRDNLGFTKANNQGIDRSTGRYVMLLNNDTRVLPGAFDESIRYLDKKPSVGAAGLKLLNEDGSRQLSCRRFPSFSQALFNRYSLLTKLFPNNKFSRDYLMTDFDDSRIQEVDWVSGACLLFRRSVLEEIGALDENYFMYSEDVDYCYRVWELGLTVEYLPFSQVYHLIGQDTKKVKFKLTVERHRSMYKFYKKHYSRNLMLIDALTALTVWTRCGIQLLPILPQEIRKAWNTNP